MYDRELISSVGKHSPEMLTLFTYQL